MPTPAANCWFLSGPTASGKTAVGLELAARLNADVLSLDSMAIYRGMDIGTAKPTVEERRRAAHHLIDICDPTEDFSVSDYLNAALPLVDALRSRGREPLFVGGTPLYLKTLLRGMFEGPPADWEFRREIQAELAEIGVEALHERLRQVDPLSAAKLHPHDQRRIIRALEVYKQTGTPISHLQMQFDEGRSANQCRVFVLQWPRTELRNRISRRVDAMFAAGLIDEVRGLLERFGKLSRTALQSVGYPEAIAHLQGELPLEDAVERVKLRTYQFAKRQETWFRSLSECRFVPLAGELEPERVAEEIWRMGQK